MASTVDIKVHLFHLEEHPGSRPLSEILERLSTTDLEERTREIAGVSFRADQICSGYWNQLDINSTKLWMVNMVNFRPGHGPGRANQQKMLSEIDFEGDYLGEDAALVYDPSQQMIALQYSHSGPRSVKISSYFGDIVHSETNTYNFRPKVDQDVERKFQTQKDITRFEATIDTTAVNKKDFRKARGMSSVYAAVQQAGGTKLKISISVDGRGGGKMNSTAKDMVEGLYNLFKKKPDSVTRLESKGEVDNASAELLDLVNARLVEEVSVPLNEVSWRVDVQDRWGALCIALNRWKQRGVVK